MKTFILSEKEACGEIAGRIAKLLAYKPDALIALTAGDTTTNLYDLLSHMCAEDNISFALCKILCLTEYVDCDNQSFCCADRIKSQLVGKTDIKEKNFITLTRENIDSIDAYIDECGGIDLSIVGIGMNGHIAYNEPTSAYNSISREVKLAPASVRELRAKCPENESVPEKALTVGLSAILNSKEIIVAAFGDSKAESVFQMLYARDDSYVPSAYLQLPANVLVYIDEAAAAKL